MYIKQSGDIYNNSLAFHNLLCWIYGLYEGAESTLSVEVDSPPHLLEKVGFPCVCVVKCTVLFFPGLNIPCVCLLSCKK